MRSSCGSAGASTSAGARELVNLAWVTVVILFAQVLLGAMNVWAGEQAWLIVAHLAVGTLLWLALIRFAFTLTSVPEVSAAGARRRTSVEASGALSPVARRAG